jgi:hypothetical protein
MAMAKWTPDAPLAAKPAVERASRPAAKRKASPAKDRSIPEPGSAKFRAELAARVGRRVQALIDLRGYPTIEQFAHQNGFEKSALSKMIRGLRVPRLDTLVKLAHALGATVDDLYIDERLLALRPPEYREQATGFWPEE